MKKTMLLVAFCSLQIALFSQSSFLGMNELSRKFPAPNGMVFGKLKSAMNVFQRLDSIHSSSPGTAGNEVIYMEGYDYDSNNRSMGYFSLELNSANQMMDTTYRELYVYDANGRIQELKVWNFDGTSFSLSSKSLYTYDNNGNITLNTGYLWDNVMGVWTENQQVISTYDAQNQLTQETTQMWDMALLQWVNMSRVSNVYGTNGIVSYLSEYFDSASGVWMPMSQSVYTYNLQGWLISENNQYYDDVLGTWTSNGLLEYTYNGSGQQESVISSYYDSSLEIYIPASQVNYVYDAAGNNVQQISVDPSDPFNPFYRQNFTFDNNFSFADLILPHYLVQDIPEYFTHKLMNLNMETWDGSQWVLESSADLFYSQQTVNGVIDYSTDREIVLYPNPAVSQLVIKTNGVNLPAVLIDSKGSCIQRQNITGTEQVDVSSLSSGVYHWIINGKSYTFVK